MTTCRTIPTPARPHAPARPRRRDWPASRSRIECLSWPTAAPFAGVVRALSQRRHRTRQAPATTVALWCDSCPNSQARRPGAFLRHEGRRGARPFLLFLFDYLIRGGFRDGKPGLVFHVLQRFWFRFLVDAKIYEMRRKGKLRDTVAPGTSDEVSRTVQRRTLAGGVADEEGPASTMGATSAERTRLM